MEPIYQSQIRKTSLDRSKILFPELCFVHYQYNKVLVYPDTLPIDEVVQNNFMLKSELEALESSRKK